MVHGWWSKRLECVYILLIHLLFQENCVNWLSSEQQCCYEHDVYLFVCVGLAYLLLAIKQVWCFNTCTVIQFNDKTWSLWSIQCHVRAHTSSPISTISLSPSPAGCPPSRPTTFPRTGPSRPTGSTSTSYPTSTTLRHSGNTPTQTSPARSRRLGTDISLMQSELYLIHTHTSRTLLGTLLSLQPQRSVAQGESKEDKVRQSIGVIAKWSHTYRKPSSWVDCLSLHQPHCDSVWRDLSQYTNTPPYLILHIIITCRFWTWLLMCWNIYQIQLITTALTSSSLMTWTPWMSYCYKRYASWIYSYPIEYSWVW